jgi:hypothetical protein
MRLQVFVWPCPPMTLTTPGVVWGPTQHRMVRGYVTMVVLERCPGCWKPIERTCTAARLFCQILPVHAAGAKTIGCFTVVWYAPAQPDQELPDMCPSARSYAVGPRMRRCV